MYTNTTATARSSCCSLEIDEISKRAYFSHSSGHTRLRACKGAYLVLHFRVDNQFTIHQSWPLIDPVAPVAYQVILEPGIGQFREFEPRRVHIRVNSLGLFLVDKLTSGKRESVS